MEHKIKKCLDEEFYNYSRLLHMYLSWEWYYLVAGSFSVNPILFIFLPIQKNGQTVVQLFLSLEACLYRQIRLCKGARHDMVGAPTWPNPDFQWKQKWKNWFMILTIIIANSLLRQIQLSAMLFVNKLFCTIMWGTVTLTVCCDKHEHWIISPICHFPTGSSSQVSTHMSYGCM